MLVQSRCAADTCAASGVLHFDRKMNPHLHAQSFPERSHLCKSLQIRKKGCPWTLGFYNPTRFCTHSSACWTGLAQHRFCMHSSAWWAGLGQHWGVLWILWHSDPQLCNQLKPWSLLGNACGVSRVSQKHNQSFWLQSPAKPSPSSGQSTSILGSQVVCLWPANLTLEAYSKSIWTLVPEQGPQRGFTPFPSKHSKPIK